MNRSRSAVAVAAVLALLSTQALRADVRSEQKTKFQLAGALGKVVNFFGGSAARDGVTSTVAVKGNRMMTTSGTTTGQIIDLGEEKVYELDLRKKTYTVAAFADLRRAMEEGRKKAEEEAKREQPAEANKDPSAKEYEVDFDVKNTGEKKDSNGFPTSQAVVTITVREKGKPLQQAGGMVMTSDMWLTPSIPAMKEVAEFRLKYAQKLYGPMMEGASPQDMVRAMAMYPQMKPALEKMAAEGSKLQGTPVLTTITFDAVKSAEQMAAEEKGGSDAKSSGGGGSAVPTSIGGLVGGFGRRMAQRKSDDKAAADAGPKDRATVLTTSTETLKVTTTVADADVAIPAGFKETK